MRDFWIVNTMETTVSTTYTQSVNTIQGGGTINWQSGSALAYKNKLPLKLSYSKNQVPTTGNLGDFSNNNSGIDDTAETRPYNFCMRMYMKL